MDGGKDTRIQSNLDGCAFATSAQIKINEGKYANDWTGKIGTDTRCAVWWHRTLDSFD